MNNLNYTVILNGNPVSREDYLQSMGNFYSNKPESRMPGFPKDANRFCFMSEGMIQVNPMKINATLILSPRNEEWIKDLEELASVKGKFSLQESKK